MRRLFLLFFCCNTSYLFAQKEIPLYKSDIPNSIKYNRKIDTLYSGFKLNAVSVITTPTITIFQPERKNINGISVIIFAGGGYSSISYFGEGLGTAQNFVNHGITAFLVKYRLPNDSAQINKSIAPLQDAQQAIKLVRENAARWFLDTNKIGVMGFSAGGHLASTLATHFEEPLIENTQHTNLRPDLLILIYPVMTMKDPLAHKGSKENLLGKNPSDSLINYFSNETHVNSRTPPTILLHTTFDKVVDVDNSIMFYEALRKANVPAEMHLYPKGDHGFILWLDPKDWMEPIIKWINNSLNFK